MIDSPRLNRTVHISEPVAKLVEKARRADRPIAVAVATGGAAQIIRKPREVAVQSDEGQVDDIVLPDTRTVASHPDHLPKPSVPDTSNGIETERRHVGKSFRETRKSGGRDEHSHG